MKRACFCALGWACLSALAIGCGGDDSSKPQSSDDYDKQATANTKTYVNGQLEALTKAAQALKDAAPAPDDDGWNATDDADALAAMKKTWATTRDTYERVEGSIAVLFAELDVSTDERYDGCLSDNGPY